MPALFDTSVPHIARVYDYWLGGKDNFAADREAAEQVHRGLPGHRLLGSGRTARSSARAVRYLAGRGGHPPVPRHRHRHPDREQHPRGRPGASRPAARIVYVDNDPIVLAHARALLTSTPEGATAYIDADLRDTGHDPGRRRPGPWTSAGRSRSC